ncbi:hypothetical protein HY994_05240 [Candidatus Micrarchaeota archaeon]|nr:hypothetical protein [Candidatus Micrarchaeota archaeon]
MDGSGFFLFTLALLASAVWAAQTPNSDALIHVQSNGKTQDARPLLLDSTHSEYTFMLQPGTPDRTILSAMDGIGLFKPRSDVGPNPQLDTEKLNFKTSEGKSCLKFAPTAIANQYKLTLDSLCQVCGIPAELQIRYKTGADLSRFQTAKIGLDINCKADVLIVTRTGMGEDKKRLLEKDTAYADALRDYIQALAHDTPEPLSGRYVELDSVQTAQTFPTKITPVKPKISLREKNEPKLIAYKKGIATGLELAQQIQQILPHVGNRYLLILGGERQMPMPAQDERTAYENKHSLSRLSKDGFIPSDELYVRDWSEQRPITVALGRLPLAVQDASPAKITEKLRMYASTRKIVIEKKDNLIIMDQCGGPDCWVFGEGRTNPLLAQDPDCEKTGCKKAPKFCTGHTKTEACNEVEFYTRMSRAKALYIQTHGTGDFMEAITKDHQPLTVLNAEDIYDYQGSFSQPAVYTDACYGATIRLSGGSRELTARTSMALAFWNKGALFYFGSTRSVPSYDQTFEKGFNPRDKFVLLTTANNPKVGQDANRIGDAWKDMKNQAKQNNIEKDGEGNGVKSIAALGFVLYGDPTLRASGPAENAKNTRTIAPKTGTTKPSDRRAADKAKRIAEKLRPLLIHDGSTPTYAGVQTASLNGQTIRTLTFDCSDGTNACERQILIDSAGNPLEPIRIA